MNSSSSNWVVSVSTENDNPYIAGPYPKTRAQQIADAFNRKSEERPQDKQNSEYLYATAYPLKKLAIADLLAEFAI